MIYSVEDDQSIRDLVLYALKQTGFEAEGFAEGQSFREAVQKEIPELVLMDQMLPGVDGETLLLELRHNPRTAHVPVIMLTAKGSEMDKVRSLDNGADDYLVKPFGVMELLSRVKAVLRRATPQEELRRLEIGTLSMDLDRHLVQSDGESVTLTNKEYELLKCLMQNPQIVFTRTSPTTATPAQWTRTSARFGKSSRAMPPSSAPCAAWAIVWRPRHDRPPQPPPKRKEA